MIPNPIIPTDPRRGAVNKTSETELVRKVREEILRSANILRPTELALTVESVIEMHLCTTPAPEPQPEVAAEPVAWRTRDEGDRDWMALVFDDPRFDVALAAVPGLVAEPLYANPPPVVEEAVKAEREANIAALQAIYDNPPSHDPGVCLDMAMRAIARSATP